MVSTNGHAQQSGYKSRAAYTRAIYQRQVPDEGDELIALMQAYDERRAQAAGHPGFAADYPSPDPPSWGDLWRGKGTSDAYLANFPDRADRFMPGRGTAIVVVAIHAFWIAVLAVVWMMG